jgi:hypothetical protein
MEETDEFSIVGSANSVGGGYSVAMAIMAAFISYGRFALKPF